MFKKENTRVIYLYAETPLHAGGGASLGAVDLPLQREAHTLYPLVQASGVKGALRELVSEISNNSKDIDTVFGPEDGDRFGGCVSFTDAKLLLLPVRSLKGVFAWVTCRDILEKFKIHLKFTKDSLDFEVPNAGTAEFTLVTTESNLLIKDKQGHEKIVLEEFTFNINKDKDIKENVTKVADFICSNVFPDDGNYEYWKRKMMENLVILPDNYFSYFVQHSTEIVTRIKIGDKGVVDKTGLWQEENLPSDSVLYAITMAVDPFTKDTDIADAKNALNWLENCINGEVFQLGGNSTIGRGIVRINIPGEDKK